MGFLQRLFSTLGDEKYIEDIHQHIRDADRAARHVQSLTCRKQCYMLLSQVLDRAAGCHEMPDPAGVAAAFVQQRQVERLPFEELLEVSMQGNDTGLCRVLQDLIGKKNWKSTNPAGLYEGSAAWAWFLHCQEHGLSLQEQEAGWRSKLLQFADLVVQTVQAQKDRYFLIIGPGPWAVQALELLATTEGLVFAPGLCRPCWLYGDTCSLQSLYVQPYTLTVTAAGITLQPGDTKGCISLIGRALQKGLKLSSLQWEELWAMEKVSSDAGQGCSSAAEALVRQEVPEEEQAAALAKLAGCNDSCSNEEIHADNKMVQLLLEQLGLDKDNRDEVRALQEASQRKQAERARTQRQKLLMLQVRHAHAKRAKCKKRAKGPSAEAPAAETPAAAEAAAEAPAVAEAASVAVEKRTREPAALQTPGQLAKFVAERFGHEFRITLDSSAISWKYVAASVVAVFWSVFHVCAH